MLEKVIYQLCAVILSTLGWLLFVCNGIAVDSRAGKTEGPIRCGGKTLKLYWTEELLLFVALVFCFVSFYFIFGQMDI